jgi:hypothetical protein
VQITCKLSFSGLSFTGPHEASPHRPCARSAELKRAWLCSYLIAGLGRSAMRSAFFLRALFTEWRVKSEEWRTKLHEHLRALSKNPFLVHVWNTWACYIKNLLMQTCKQANKKARVQIVRLLYFADLHGGYKQIGPFRFFVVVPLHRQKTKTRSAATGVFRAATECGCGPTKGSEFPTRDGGQSKTAAKPPLSCRWVAKCGCGCKEKVKGNERRITKDE